MTTGAPPPVPAPASGASPAAPFGFAARSIKEDHDAFVRWQKVRINHLGKTVNLVLTLTTAAVGFAVKLMVEGKVAGGEPARGAFLAAVALLLLAVALGLYTNYSRLMDFRRTALAARGRELSKRQDAGEKFTSSYDLELIGFREQNRDAATRFGRRTWIALRLQFTAFVAGIVLLAWAMALIFRIL